MLEMVASSGRFRDGGDGSDVFGGGGVEKGRGEKMEARVDGDGGEDLLRFCAGAGWMGLRRT